MKVCGFTFIRNAIKYDYPVVEAITSILTLCDKFIVIAGNSEDKTREVIEGINSPKIKIIDSIWNENLRKGGSVLAEETNKAIDHLPPEFDWAFYIQADEVLHEDQLPIVKSSMEKWKYDMEVEGLLFNYNHFYGSYDFIGDSSRWYRNEVRVIRCNTSIRSYRDAQGFRKNNKVLNVKRSNATIFHYGWVKPPIKQQDKQKYFHSLWHSEERLAEKVTSAVEYDYSSIDSLICFKDTHPTVMTERIENSNWKFDYDVASNKLGLKSRIKLFVEKYTGWRPGEYKNYRLIK